MKKPVKLRTYIGQGESLVAFGRKGRTYLTAICGGQIQPIGLVGDFKFVVNFDGED